MTHDVPLAEVVRSGFVEGVHRGRLVVLDPDGGVRLALGDVTGPVFPRSANKPMQAAGLLDAGLLDVVPGFDDRVIAMAAASHAGASLHQDAVRAMLAAGGLDEAALGTPAEWPLDRDVRDDLVRAGGAATRIAMNCSGKHAAMLLTCVANGWPTAGYLHPDHEVQRRCLRAVEQLSGEAVAVTGVDGCGAPLYALSLTGLATAYRHAVLHPQDSAERRVADAMRAWPQYVSGDGRIITEAMRGVPGLLVKDGAEGVCAGALSDGTAFAVKIADGAERAVAVVAVALLRDLGVSAPVLERVGSVPLLGGGVPVGEVRAVPIVTKTT